ncbi:Os03g0212500 [Oryza sativa Japonica Group]|uniref:Os03g0212500 protein n=1 Tax=Oryza sativa subsp. japonica TaxID=39947 RepID=A0A0N7KGT7_ORYSJ|nr:Os03g0212500 [Oryza sativa Japonica Group]
MASGTTKPCGADRDVGVISPPGPVDGRGGGGRWRRSALYDSFELNAMVVRLNRLLASGSGDGGGAGGGGGAAAAARARRAGSWSPLCPRRYSAWSSALSVGAAGKETAGDAACDRHSPDFVWLIPEEKRI